MAAGPTAVPRAVEVAVYLQAVAAAWARLPELVEAIREAGVAVKAGGMELDERVAQGGSMAGAREVAGCLAVWTEAGVEVAVQATDAEEMAAMAALAAATPGAADWRVAMAVVWGECLAADGDAAQGSRRAERTRRPARRQYSQPAPPRREELVRAVAAPPRTRPPA